MPSAGNIRVLVRSALVLTPLAVPSAPAGPVEFPIPSDDRWHYPFNFTPGARAVAACFSSVGNVTFPSFNDRDGILLVAWETDEGIPAGRCPDKYAVESVTVILTSTPGATWVPDLTTDEWFTFDANNDGVVNGDGVPRGAPSDQDGESSDGDPGRPLELFGVGFGPHTDYQTWSEETPYYGASESQNLPRDPFPYVPQSGTGVLLHVEDSVKGTHNDQVQQPVYQFTPRPWSVGKPHGYTPGQQSTPFSVEFPLDLDAFDGAVLRYVQEQLAGGRLIFAVTSMQETVIFGGGDGEYATFYTKEGTQLHPLARAPRLVIVLGTARPSGDANDDCTVDLSDAASLATCMSGPDARPAPLPPLTAARCLDSFDFDQDGDVDLADVCPFLERYDP